MPRFTGIAHIELGVSYLDASGVRASRADLGTRVHLPPEKASRVRSAPMLLRCRDRVRRSQVGWGRGLQCPCLLALCLGRFRHS